jgi:ABC-type antimicrobial peptide transport system permease subunit
VALLLAGIGLYGVLKESLLRRRRELGIRIAIGAPARHIMRHAVFEELLMVAAGAVTGLFLALFSLRYIESLVYQVKPGDPASLLVPVLILSAAVLLASMPAAIGAVRIDPAEMLRAE